MSRYFPHGGPPADKRYHRRFHTLSPTLDAIQAFIHRTPMALKATVYKTELEIVDMDRNVYETRQLTLARKLKLRWSV